MTNKNEIEKQAIYSFLHKNCLPKVKARNQPDMKILIVPSF